MTDGGYLHGALAPGHRNRFEAPIAAHHLLRAHGAAVQAYRASGKHRIGLVVNLEPKYTASASAEDQAARARADAYMNRQYLDPVFKGCYPEELCEVFGEAWPQWPAAGFELIRQPRATYTETQWEVYPQGLTDMLLWVKERYGNIPLYVSEHCAAFFDLPTAEDGRIDDPLRVSYLRHHIAAVRGAIDKGADVRAYFVCSLFDNFEWALGYSKRFGIVHVDYATLARTPKASAAYYSKVIAAHAVVP